MWDAQAQAESDWPVMEPFVPAQAFRAGALVLDFDVFALDRPFRAT
jgi:hypothetical protein